MTDKTAVHPLLLLPYTLFLFPPSPSLSLVLYLSLSNSLSLAPGTARMGLIGPVLTTPSLPMKSVFPIPSCP